MAVLPNLEQQLAVAQAALAAANAKMAAMEAKGPGVITPKVSKSGAVSVYGMGRYPVTLYAEQWSRISEAMPSILAFIKTNPTSRFNDKGERVSEGGTVVSLSRKAA
jgi:hypothetical protein